MDMDTIAAISTGLTNSGVSMIRISGGDSFSVIDRIYRSGDGKKKLSLQESHTIHHGFVLTNHGSDLEEAVVLDEVLVSLMRGPHTYTKEDTVEINCHGGVLVTQKILEEVLRAGARLAEPGEFTKRAFLNGRMDLSQAESVMDLISAKNEFALKTSLSQLQGALGTKIRQIRESLLYEVAAIESALDDPEALAMEEYGEELFLKVEQVKKEIEVLLEQSEQGILRKDGIKTVIVGKPNVGKSSLMNLLLGMERAIVTDVPGTTRDVISEQMNHNGIPLQLIDTAGIRSTEDVVEKIGVEKSREHVKEADLILYLIDTSTDLDENDDRIMELLSKHEKKAIVLLNKSDLPAVVTKEIVREKIGQYEKTNREDKNRKSGSKDGNSHEGNMKIGENMIAFSVRKNMGLEELEQAIKDLFFDGAIDSSDELVITNIRHKEALEHALESLNFVKESIESGMPEDFFSIDLIHAYEELGKISGESLGEDIINEIFAKFCMGK
jgi:tRNA modification GTPase